MPLCSPFWCHEHENDHKKVSKTDSVDTSKLIVDTVHAHIRSTWYRKKQPAKNMSKVFKCILSINKNSLVLNVGLSFSDIFI